jgi:hypothetical protein
MPGTTLHQCNEGSPRSMSKMSMTATTTDDGETKNNEREN